LHEIEVTEDRDHLAIFIFGSVLKFVVVEVFADLGSVSICKLSEECYHTDEFPNFSGISVLVGERIAESTALEQSVEEG